MGNYHYIIAGLPDLLLDYGPQALDAASLQKSVTEMLSNEDRRLIDWLDFGLNKESISRHFYRAAAHHPNLFIREYFSFDKCVRDARICWLDQVAFEGDFEEYPRLKQIFAMNNLIDRERRLDHFMWDKINEITSGELFNINVLLGFFTKARIVERWTHLDPESGRELFARLVNEVRGTFKGVNYES
jgi:hypothetical protein